MEGQLKNCKLVMNGKYGLGRVLGQGTFARVYYARNVHTGKSVAMKVIIKEKVVKAKMMDQMKREISIMKRLKHPNIVELYEVMATKSKIFLAMEFVRGGELHGKVSKEGKFDEVVGRKYFQQLISAVDYCHSRGDTLEFNQFCLNQLHPALFDVVWTSADNSTVASSYPCAVLC